MLMWLVEHWLLNLPSEFWIALAVVGFLAFFFASMFSHIPPLRPYMMFVKPVGGLIIIVSVFMYGGTAINDIWQDRIEKARLEAEKKDKELEEKNIKLAQAQQKAANDLKIANDKRNKDIGKLDNALKEALKNGTNNGVPPSPQVVIQNLSDEERKKYENMNEEKKKEYEGQINELLDSLKNCPVPKRVIDEINQTITDRGAKK
jgi:hypothetical protein